MARDGDWIGAFPAPDLHSRRLSFGRRRNLPGQGNRDAAARHRRKRPTDSDSTHETGKGAGCRDYFQHQITNAGNGQNIRAAGKLHPRG